jgi:hypothetical protein
MRVKRLFVALVTATAAACGSDTTTQPSGNPVAVTSVTPATGSSLGGTPVTLSGSNFTSGATVTIGDVPATNVVVVGATTITAVTPPHAVGKADVAVVVGGSRAALTGAFTFASPAATANAAPVISSLTAQGPGTYEPAQFASLKEALTVTAVVTDLETPTSQLVFTWSATAGTFSGTGPIVTWTAPAQLTPTPTTVTISLTVTENYQAADGAHQNQTKATTTVRVHDSVKEIGDLATDFLVAFSKQLDPAYAVRNFSDNCSQKQDELGDVEKNNRDNTINAYVLGTPDVTVGFNGYCPFRGVPGNACAQVPSQWDSTNKTTGKRGVVTGIDQVTAVLENDKWLLCASDYQVISATGSITHFQFGRR